MMNVLCGLARLRFSISVSENAVSNLIWARVYNRASNGDVNYLAASPQFRSRARFLALGWRADIHVFIMR